MKILTQKRSFFSDFAITKKSKNSSFCVFSRAFLLLFIFIFSSNFSSLNASIIVATLQQKPTTKTTPKTSPSTVKVDKDKLKARLNKNKKKVVVKKDTIRDIDPASTGTPLYKNDN
jgi:hypothetical protein